jgi:hypothetical protein
VGENPLLYGRRYQDQCVACGTQKAKTVNRYTSEAAATSSGNGIFYGGASLLRGKDSEFSKEWSLSAQPIKGLEIGNIGEEEYCALNKDKVYLGNTEYRKNAIIYVLETGETYQPQELQVCQNGETKIWKVLAFTGPVT